MRDFQFVSTNTFVHSMPKPRSLVWSVVYGRGSHAPLEAIRIIESSEPTKVGVCSCDPKFDPHFRRPSDDSMNRLSPSPLRLDRCFDVATTAVWPRSELEGCSNSDRAAYVTI